MNEATQATMRAIESELRSQGWAAIAESPSRTWLDSVDGDVRVFVNYSDEQVKIIRFGGGRAKLIEGEATFTGSLIAAAYTLVVEG